MKLKDAKATVRTYRATLLKSEDGEYCVTLDGDNGAQSYFTNDLTDAIGTARLMREERDRAEALQNALINVARTVNENRAELGYLAMSRVLSPEEQAPLQEIIDALDAWQVATNAFLTSGRKE